MNSPEFLNSQALQKILEAEIASSSHQRISFAKYMDIALYHPDYGYYNSGITKIGKEGDFFTSSSLGKDFGELLGIQFKQMWHNLGCPNPFYLVEMGAGNGELAQDVLNYFQLENDRLFTQALRYTIVEQSPALVAVQQHLLTSFTALDVTWKTWSDIAQESIVGCFFSNELVDAFPVHIVNKNRDKLQEVHLSLEQGELTETIDSLSDDRINQYFDLVEIDLSKSQYPPNYRTEVNLKALDWLKTVSSSLKQGYVLTKDYGYPAAKYYRPSRTQGTLQCYFQHRRHNIPYANLGYQDITAHVDFTALERQGERWGLETLGYTQQGLFLMALGIGDRLNELSSGKFDINEIFQRRDALHQLIDPTGLGGFGVLIQGKNLNASQQSLRGLTVPPMF
ncbi:MAG: class I SAM-dependent methyltransferase [Pleurocapsa sp.]